MSSAAVSKRVYERGEEHSVWFEEAERVIKERAGKVLSEEQQRYYFEHGYLLVENCVGSEWLERLRKVMERAVEAARSEDPNGAESKDFVFEPTHTPENPRLSRLNNPVDWDEVFHEFTTNGPVAEVAKDLLGPSIRYHHSKLNFKWHSGGQAIAWHQDITGWPHTNYSPLTIGVYLEDVDEVMGPLGVIPDSHLGPVYDEGPTGKKTREEEVDFTRAAYLAGKAGSITVHNCRMIHGSRPNQHKTRARPLLLQTYAAANAVPLLQVGSSGPKVMNWGSNPGRSGLRLGALISGEEPEAIVFDPRPVPAVFLSEEEIKRPHKPSFFKDAASKM